MSTTAGHRRVPVACALLVGVALVVIVAGGTAGPGRGTCLATLVPAYVPATALARLGAPSGEPRLLVVNPHNGPGAAEDRAYRAAVGQAQARGAHVLGYVHTRWGARDAAAVRGDVERYRRWYGVDGIFLDEAATQPERLPYYRAAADAARRAGARLVALNPGVVPDRGYFDLADVVVTFEGPYADYDAAVEHQPAWVRDLDARTTAHLVYGASRAEALRVVADGRAGHLYVTSGVQPNPWATLPAYLREQEDALAKGRCP